jgi:hypothetical protein
MSGTRLRILLLTLTSLLIVFMVACSNEQATEPTEPPQSTVEIDINCTETNPHPVGQSIAESFNLTYEEVMTWFCSGYTFEEILLALQTSRQTDLPAEELLEMSQSKSWEEIWEETDLFGQ